jgi:thioredoxin 1
MTWLSLLLVVTVVAAALLAVVGASSTTTSTSTSTAAGRRTCASDVVSRRVPAPWGHRAALLKVRGGYSADSGVIHITTADEFNKIVDGSEGKLVHHHNTTSWCGPCKMIAPAYDAMSAQKEFSDVIFLKVDVDEVPDLAEKFQVQAMPTFLFLKGNQEVDRFSGASADKLRETVVNHNK